MVRREETKNKFIFVRILKKGLVHADNKKHTGKHVNIYGGNKESKIRKRKKNKEEEKITEDN